MKAGEIIDAAIELPQSPIVIEMHNGNRASTSEYYHSEDKRGNPIIVIKVGRLII